MEHNLTTRPARKALTWTVAATAVFCSACQSSTQGGSESSTRPSGGSAVAGQIIVKNADGKSIDKDHYSVTTVDDVFADEAQIPKTTSSWFTFAPKSHKVANTLPEKGKLRLSAKVSRKPSGDSIPVLHSLTDQGHTLIPAEYDDATTTMTIDVSGDATYNFGWLFASAFTAAIDSHADKNLAPVDDKPTCPKTKPQTPRSAAEAGKQSVGNKQLFWLCPSPGSERSSVQMVNNTYLPLLIGNSQKATIQTPSSTKKLGSTSTTISSWVKQATKDKRPVVLPGGAAAVTLNDGDTQDATPRADTLHAEILAPWYLVAVLTKTMFASTPEGKHEALAEQLESVKMAACLDDKSGSLLSKGTSKLDNAQQQKLSTAVIECFALTTAKVANINPTWASSWNLLTQDPDELAQTLTQIWQKSAKKRSLRASVEKENSRESGANPGRAAQLRLQPGGKITNVSSG